MDGATGLFVHEKNKQLGLLHMEQQVGLSPWSSRSLTRAQGCIGSNGIALDLTTWQIDEAGWLPRLCQGLRHHSSPAQKLGGSQEYNT